MVCNGSMIIFRAQILICFSPPPKTSKDLCCILGFVLLLMLVVQINFFIVVCDLKQKFPSNLKCAHLNYSKVHQQIISTLDFAILYLRL